MRRVGAGVNFDHKTKRRYIQIYRTCCALEMDDIPRVMKMVGGENMTLEMDTGVLPNGLGPFVGNNASVDEYLAIHERPNGGRNGKCLLFQINTRNAETMTYHATHFIMPS